MFMLINSHRNIPCLRSLGGPQPRFQRMRGVSRCIVGYTGGQTLHPTYRNIQDHTEALLVEFDPTFVTYKDLCMEWSRMHTPVGKPKCQYRSAIWYLDQEQQETALEVVKGLTAVHGTDNVSSSVEPVTRFYRAEEYHQNFMAKNY